MASSIAGCALALMLGIGMPITEIRATEVGDTKPKAAPGMYENPKQSDPKQELIRLRTEGTAQFESGIGLKKALQLFEAALAQSPNSAVELYNVATARRRLGNVEEALQLYKRAQKADPQLAHPHYGEGLILRSSGQHDAALAAFLAARERAAAAPSVHYQLGRLYREEGRSALALQSFVNTLQLDPYHPGALYQLYLYYQDANDAEKAKATFEEFARVKKALGNTRKELNDDETELARPIAAFQQPDAETTIRFTPAFSISEVSAGVGANALDVRDIDEDGLEDIIIAERAGRVSVLNNRGGRGYRNGMAIELPGAGVIYGVLVESFSRTEGYRIVAATDNGVWLTAREAKAPENSFVKISPTASTAVAAVDVEGDGDVDLVLAGKEVLVNDGNAGLRREPSFFSAQHINVGEFQSGNIIASDLSNSSTEDLIFANASGARTILKSALGGRYRRLPDATLTTVPGMQEFLRSDVDNDGRVDLVTLTNRAVVVDYNSGRYRFEQVALPFGVPLDRFARLVVGDFNNDGRKDFLVLKKGSRITLLMNRGSRKFEARELPGALPHNVLGTPIVADIDADGRLDVVGVFDSGLAFVLYNDSAGTGQALRLSLRGTRSAPSGRDATIEARRGTFYVKYESDGRIVTLPIGEAGYAEVVRIAWTNGFVENKFKVDSGKGLRFTESERVSGSCPSLFAWDGTAYRFVTDAFISGPMGVPMAPGRFFPVNHQEYIKVPGSVLKAERDTLRLSLTEELREAVFLDQVKLFAIDGPADVDVEPNEYLAPGDFPRFKLHATAGAQPPLAAHDQRGNDVLDLISKVDWRYPAAFKKLQYAGFAEQQGVEIVLPEGAAASPNLRLFLTGWFYYFESSSLISAAQRRDLTMMWPQLQVWSNDRWEKVTDIGIPAGKGKTVVLELGGRLSPETKRVRIWTNLELYWDRILVDTTAPPNEQLVVREVPLTGARLRFRGFSDLVRTEGEMPQPERFEYSEVRFGAPWNPLSGWYTRFGDVRSLLAAVDSEMAVFGPGDEIAFQFSSAGLPTLLPGHRRDYLIYFNGYVKDGDPHTAEAGALEPLPYAGMREYPYDSDASHDAVFSTDAYRRYTQQYQTRAPLRFTGPSLFGEAP